MGHILPTVFYFVRNIYFGQKVIKSCPKPHEPNGQHWGPILKKSYD